VKYPNGDLAVHSFDGKIISLNCQIHANTGIPLEAQKLYYQSRLLNEGNISSIPNGCSLELSLGLHGGTGHCDICYEDGVFTCSDCQGKVYCDDCCRSAHKHPSRSSHNPVPILVATIKSAATM
jgi:Na+-transporting NADH:ubiquinone oxidoreductase subunit NqrF